jgi:outer membrane protein assembly factor BamB
MRRCGPSRPSRWLVGAAAAVALSLAGCSAAAPPAGSGTRPAAPVRPWSHRLLLTGTFTEVASAGDVLYLLETLPHRPEPMQLLVRVDLRTGTVGYARELVPVFGTPIVVSPSGVWLLGWAWLSQNAERAGPLTLYRFDPDTLRLISRRTVGPAGCCQQATLSGWTGGRLWLSVGSVVRLIQPVPWTVLQTVRIRDGQVRWLSFSPDRRRVYLAVAPTGAGHGAALQEQALQEQALQERALQERALPGWRLLHVGTVSATLNIGPISAAGAALWVTAGGGTTGQIQLFTADLSHVRLVLGAGELARSPAEKHFFAFENGVGAAVLEGVTWLTAQNALACLQPDTGRVLAEQPGDQTHGPSITMDPVAVHGDLYGLSADGLVQLRPPAVC